MGELAAARGHLEAAVEVERVSQWAFFLTQHLIVLGTLDRLDGNLAAARARGEEALEVAQRLGSGWMQAGAECLLGRLALAAGEATEAERHIHGALGRLVARGFTIDVPECLDILAAVAATQESFEETARLLGAAEAGRQRLGIVRFPPEPEFWSPAVYRSVISPWKRPHIPSPHQWPPERRWISVGSPGVPQPAS